MEEQENFLKVLEGKLDELQEEGLISSEQLQKGFWVNFRSLNFKELDSEVLSKTMADILKSNNPNYEKNAINRYEIRMYDPNSISDFGIFKKRDGLEIKVER